MRVIGAGAAVVIAFALVAGCGGSSGSPSSPGPAGPVTINIVGERGANSFSPNPAEAAGQMVVFRNTDSVVHRVRLNDASLDTGDIAPGATSSPVRMPAGGTNYHCALHTTMIGAVNAAGSAPPRCTGDYC
jgi:plastocyanin